MDRYRTHMEPPPPYPLIEELRMPGGEVKEKEPCECGRPKDPKAQKCRECWRAPSHERRERILSLWHAGSDYGEIAEALGCSRATVRTTLARMRARGYNVPARDFGRR